MRKYLTSITDLIGTDRQYEVYYSCIGIFGSIVQIFYIMGITFDPNIPIKYADLLKNDKETYLFYFSSLECFADSLLEEPLK